MFTTFYQDEKRFCLSQIRKTGVVTKSDGDDLLILKEFLVFMDFR